MDKSIKVNFLEDNDMGQELIQINQDKLYIKAIGREINILAIKKID